ncbi:MAG: nuclear transport factor 2 family protein [Daejeonella sp.]|uniref:nuclear transport factor 2 family protein n=1 Tax=Daejeonella sp. JGW-45 TaxID=3034148 RepID=UPI0023EC80F1|nr:nuclear transport factor 2 family protein [Daejeonella sp. JGW-45]
MRNVKNSFVLIALLAVVACGQTESTSQTGADTTAVAATATATPEDEQAVATAVDSLNKSIVNPEKSRLENIASDALSYGHSGGKVQNKAEFVDDLINGPFDFQSVDAADQTIAVSGDNAIVRHTFIAKATNAGAPTDIKIGILLVLRKENGDWKLLARQAFKLPDPVK